MNKIWNDDIYSLEKVGIIYNSKSINYENTVNNIKQSLSNNNIPFIVSNIDNLDPKIDVTPEDAYNEAAEQYYEENDIRHNKRE